MEKLLAEELATEKMRYTLELKDKQVKQTELEAQADKVRREKSAEAAGQEQVIAAKAQAEAMKHVLPFKQKQIEQRGLEAEAEKVARIKNAEASSQARQIEATGEAESRRKLADADAYRQDRIGKIASEQLARDGALITRHPLLIQKTLADKLSDKISVIIAPPPADGGFIGATLLGASRQNAAQRPPPARRSWPENQAGGKKETNDHARHRLACRHRHRHPGPVALRAAPRDSARSRPCCGRATAWKSAARKATTCRCTTIAGSAPATSAPHRCAASR